MSQTDTPLAPALYEAMSSLRAVRRLKPDPIPEDVLTRILQAAAGLLQNTLPPPGGTIPLEKVLVFLGGSVVLLAVNVYFLVMRQK